MGFTNITFNTMTVLSIFNNGKVKIDLTVEFDFNMYI